jgi:hypothetical protein
MEVFVSDCKAIHREDGAIAIWAGAFDFFHTESGGNGTTRRACDWAGFINRVTQ